MRYERLRNIVEITKGKKVTNVGSLSPTFRYRYIQTEDIQHNRNVKYTDEQDLVQVTTNDVVIAWDGLNSGTVGYNLTGIIGSTLARLRLIDPQEIYPPYLGLFLQSRYEYLKGHSAGVTIPHLDRERLEGIPIPVASPEMQRLLVDVLLKARGLVDKGEKSIQLLEQLLQDSFLQLFGDPYRNPKGWPVVRMDTVIKKIEKGVQIAGEPRKKGRGEIGVLKLAAVTSGEFKPDEYKTIERPATGENHLSLLKGDILFSRTNVSGSGAVACMVDNDYSDLILPDTLWRISLDATASTNAYFMFVLNQEGFKKSLARTITATSGAATGISEQQFNTHGFPKAPIGLQQEFAVIYEEVISVKKKSTARLPQLQNFYTSLLQQAFENDSVLLAALAERSFGPDRVQATIAFYRFLEETVSQYEEDQRAIFLHDILSQALEQMEEAPSNALQAVLAENGLPGMEWFLELQSVEQWFNEYHTYHHTYARWELDHANEALHNLNNCIRTLQQLLGHNRFFTFSPQTAAFGQFLLARLENEQTDAEADLELERKRFEGEDEASRFLKGSDGLDIITIGGYDINLMDVVGEGRLVNFSIADLCNALESEISFQHITQEEVTQLEAQEALYAFMDRFLLSELMNQPFTFSQLKEVLASIYFQPVFEVLHRYVFDRLQQPNAALRQLYFDENMKTANETAYQYLLDLMSYELMGGQVVTPPRRLYLVYSLPKTPVTYATA